MFYIIEVSTGDSKIAGKAIYEKDTLEQAVALFHKKMGTAMDSELYTGELCVVMDSHGAVYRSEEYIAPVQPVEEPIEEEPVEPTEEDTTPESIVIPNDMGERDENAEAVEE